jgi:hypothetical protein
VLPVEIFPTGRAKRLVRVLLNSSIERRVLDEEHPDSNPSARDQHFIQNRPGGTLFTPLPERRPVISIESISSATCRRPAIRPSARLAIQLEARPRPPRIISNVSSHQDPIIQCELVQALEARQTRTIGLFFCDARLRSIN